VSLWQDIVDTFTGGVSAKPGALSELRKDREIAADKQAAEELTRGEYGQAMTPWGQLVVYDPTDPRFRAQVEDVWAEHRKTYKGKSGQRTGLSKWEVSARMSRAWGEASDAKKTKRDRPAALRAQSKHKYDTGLPTVGVKPGRKARRDPQTNDNIQSGTNPQEAVEPHSKYGRPVI
jgi:hypothetical protein